MDRIAGIVLALLIAACLAAPIYAARVSGTDPFRTNVLGTLTDGTPVLAEVTGELGAVPIGPGWRGAYALGADGLGRDVAARLLYGGRVSLAIAGGATVVCLALAAVLGVLAGFLAGPVDAVIAGGLDLLWAFPVTLLAICLSAVLVGSAQGDSLLIPAGILSIVYVPYVARPIRAQVAGLRHAEFVTAARSVGASPARVLWRHVLPQLRDTLLAFLPLVAGMMLLTEASLSILSIGVQAPHASWGTLLADGQALVSSRPLVAIAPGFLILVTVLCLNVLASARRQ